MTHRQIARVLVRQRVVLFALLITLTLCDIARNEDTPRWSMLGIEMSLHLSMLCSFIFLQAVALVLLFSSSVALPSSENSGQYIVAESNGGLANRLRALAAFLVVAEERYNGSHTVFIWEKNSACPGHFLSLFEPIPKLIFATNSSREIVNKNALVVYNNTLQGYSHILADHDIDEVIMTPVSTHRKYFHPTREIMQKVNEFVNQHNMCNISAVHLRTTDLDKIMPPRKRTNFRNIYKFMESRPEGEKVFLLTDDPKTQQHMMDKYGEKIVVYRKIANETENVQGSSTNSNTNSQSYSVFYFISKLCTGTWLPPMQAYRRTIDTPPWSTPSST